MRRWFLAAAIGMAAFTPLSAWCARNDDKQNDARTPVTNQAQANNNARPIAAPAPNPMPAQQPVMVYHAAGTTYSNPPAAPAPNQYPERSIRPAPSSNYTPEQHPAGPAHPEPVPGHMPENHPVPVQHPVGPTLPVPSPNYTPDQHPVVPDHPVPIPGHVPENHPISDQHPVVPFHHDPLPIHIPDQHPVEPPHSNPSPVHMPDQHPIGPDHPLPVPGHLPENHPVPDQHPVVPNHPLPVPGHLPENHPVADQHPVEPPHPHPWPIHTPDQHPVGPEHHVPAPHHHPEFHTDVNIVLETLTITDVDACVTQPSCPPPDPVTETQQLGTYFGCREEALANFKAHFLTVFINNFPVEPKERPYYIPRCTVYNDQMAYIAYCPAYHNYGFWDPENPDSWIPYSVWADDTMVDQLMLRNHYLYPNTTQTVDG